MVFKLPSMSFVTHNIAKPPSCFNLKTTINPRTHKWYSSSLLTECLTSKWISNPKSRWCKHVLFLRFRNPHNWRCFYLPSSKFLGSSSPLLNRSSSTNFPPQPLTSPQPSFLFSTAQSASRYTTSSPSLATWHVHVASVGFGTRIFRWWYSFVDRGLLRLPPFLTR